MDMRIKAALFSSTFALAALLTYEILEETVCPKFLNPRESHWIMLYLATILAGVIGSCSTEWTSKLRRREEQVRLREEKLASIRQVIRVAQYQVNNLSNSLQLVAIELEDQGQLSAATLAQLEKAIHDSAARLQEIGELTDPFDEGTLAVKV